jgi:DNA mismatch repair protein MutS
MSVHYDREKDILVYDRKLKEVPGNNMYGLEVCRSLNLPKDFLELANNIRIKYDKSSSILSLKESKYNNKKIRSICEECKEEYSTEVHHINPQKMADENGFIKRKDGSKFHKNHLANLMALCEKCHKKMHYNKIDLNNN